MKPPWIKGTVASFEGSSLVADKAMLVDGAVDDETVGQTSAENSLARALGSPQRPSPGSANAHDDSPTQKAQVRSRSHDGSARRHGRRDQDRQQMAVMNAANSSKGMTERPEFVVWATTEGEREEFGYAVRSSDSERASAFRFAPSGT